MIHDFVNCVFHVLGGSYQSGGVVFADQAYLHAGGSRDANGNIVGAFDGIIAGKQTQKQKLILF